MDPFLNYIHKITKLTNFPKNLHIVLGNESCDLDSTVSALALSYILDSKCKNDDWIAVPLLNVNKEEFPIRTESCFVLKKIGVDPSRLFYKDTLNIDLITKRNVKISLVDHHVLSNSQEYLKPNVIQIFDHRPIDVNVKWSDTVQIEIKIVGSCSTLVAEEIFTKNDNLLCSSLAIILYDTIIFDTIGLSPEAGKTKDLDLQVCRKLENFLKLQHPNHRNLFEELWSAHNDVSSLSSKQLLAKDLKIIENILIPGLPMLIREYLKYPNITEVLNEFCDEKNFTIIILMGLEAKGGIVQRDIAFYSVKADDKLLEFIVDNLRKDEQLKFVQEETFISTVKYFKHNNKPSRKYLVPVLKNILQNFVVISS